MFIRTLNRTLRFEKPGGVHISMSLSWLRLLTVFCPQHCWLGHCSLCVYNVLFWLQHYYVASAHHVNSNPPPHLRPLKIRFYLAKIPWGQSQFPCLAPILHHSFLKSTMNFLPKSFIICQIIQIDCLINASDTFQIVFMFTLYLRFKPRYSISRTRILDLGIEFWKSY